jgi:hypothetical protein
MLIIGSHGSFAGTSFYLTFSCVLPVDPDPILPSHVTTVLYALGTIISLIGTGFLIGVRLDFFPLRDRVL